jgi:hypothetical protein
MIWRKERDFELGRSVEVTEILLQVIKYFLCKQEIENVTLYSCAPCVLMRIQ